MRRLDVDGMLREMTATQFAGWRAARQLGAFDTVANADHRAGVIAAAVGNFAGKTLKKGAKPLVARDLIPSRIPAPPMTDAEEAEQVKALFRSIGAAKKRGTKARAAKRARKGRRHGAQGRR